MMPAPPGAGMPQLLNERANDRLSTREDEDEGLIRGLQRNIEMLTNGRKRESIYNCKSIDSEGVTSRRFAGDAAMLQEYTLTMEEKDLRIRGLISEGEAACPSES